MMIRSQDYRRIKKLTDHKLIVSRDAFYLIVVASGIDVGLMVFHPYKNAVLMHVEMSKGYRGRLASNAYLEAMEWIFENTAYDVIYGEIPQDNRAAHLMARKTGARFDGIEDGLRLYSMREETFLRKAA